mmetsp:Transcript_8425/g.25093  ORF Transcript_8425/g.25093 Transcript_8425/m.25093 type:complete len:459 (-) Transcript_8425:1971-3347(-)
MGSLRGHMFGGGGGGAAPAMEVEHAGVDSGSSSSGSSNGSADSSADAAEEAEGPLPAAVGVVHDESSEGGGREPGPPPLFLFDDTMEEQPPGEDPLRVEEPPSHDSRHEDMAQDDDRADLESLGSEGGQPAPAPQDRVPPDDHGKPLAVGQIVGQRYTLIQNVRRGHYGTIWLAQDFVVEPPRPVAIKQIITPPPFADTIESGEYYTEVDVLAACQCQFVVELLQSGLIPGHGHLMVMTWLPDGDLHDNVMAEEGLDLATSKCYMHQLAGALWYVHGEGNPRRQAWVHCDVKPTNVLICRDRGVQLADFGLAGPTHQRRSGPATGTLQYMAPELLHIANGEEYCICPQLDVWSLGITIFAVLFKKEPWGQADFFLDVHYHMFVTTVADPRQNIRDCKPWSEVPGPLRSCLINMLAETAWCRPTLEEVCHAIEEGWPESVEPEDNGAAIKSMMQRSYTL